MTNPYYGVTGAPTTQSRGYSATIRSEYGLIATGFDAVYTAMLLRGLKAGETWTGTHVFTGATVTFATQSALDNSTKAATTAYADSAVSASAVTLNASIALKADIDSPILTGIPSAPTAAAGTATTQIATTAFVAGTAFSSALPAQTGNSGKFVTTDGNNASWSAVLPSQTSNSGKFLTTNGTTASWNYAGVASITTATTATTLTSTPTLLKITPTSYGVAVTLPDATTCSLGGPLHIIDNKGAYPVRVLNSAGTLLGFIFAGVVSHVSLVDNSSAAGTWTIENSELVGASAQLLTTNMRGVYGCISIDANREFLLGFGASNYTYAVVYDKSTNTFGTPTLIRSADCTAGNVSCGNIVLSATNQVLHVSCTTSSTAFEAVTLSISGTTITVNTAATATLSANISSFADGCGLIAVGSSFVCSYTVATPAAQIRALSISGTTVTIGSAEVLDGTAGGLIAASSDKVIAVSTATTHLYTKPYTVSGSTLSAGTGTDTNSSTMTLVKFAALGTRWVALYLDNTSSMGAVVSLSGATTTITTATLFTGGGNIVDAIVVSASKVLALSSLTSSNANILTDTAGTASVGTAITLSSQTTRACLYASGTDVAVQEGTTTYIAHIVDCSGSSPVLKRTIAGNTANGMSNVQFPRFFASNSVLSKDPYAVRGSDFASTLSETGGVSTIVSQAIVKGGVFSTKPIVSYSHVGRSYYRGVSESQVWATDTSSTITKVECVV